MNQPSVRPSNQFPPMMMDDAAWADAWQRSLRLQRALREQTKLHPAIRVSDTEAPKHVEVDP